jgi:glycosyltransferase involved in cell wall biosynthesis
MKIIHFSKQDNSASGSVAFNAHKLLIEYGHNSILITKYGVNTKTELVFKSEFACYFENLIRKIVSRYFFFIKTRTDKNYYMHSLKESTGWIAERKIKRKIKKIGHADLIILYFLDNYLNFKNIYTIQKFIGAKILFYPMDMAIMTGGCHYSWDCKKFENTCGNCPGIYSDKHDDVTHENMIFKRNFLNKINHEILAPAQSIYFQLKESSLFKDSTIRKLLIPVDQEVFTPIDTSRARNYFSIRNNSKVLFYGAQGIDEKRKGFDLFLTFLDNLRNTFEKDEILILIAGQTSLNFEKLIPFNFTYLGKIDIKKELPMAYNAADIYISTSIQDSGPMMINQSLMCGTPVLAFNIGVAPDLIINGQNGYIIDDLNCAEMASKAAYILGFEKDSYKKMRAFTRQHSIMKNSNQTFFNNLIEIVNEV